MASTHLSREGVSLQKRGDQLQRRSPYVTGRIPESAHSQSEHGALSTERHHSLRDEPLPDLQRLTAHERVDVVHVLLEGVQEVVSERALLLLELLAVQHVTDHVTQDGQHGVTHQMRLVVERGGEGGGGEPDVS